MITELYNFAPGSYVVADEWNGNFSALYKTSLYHEEAIQDLTNSVAFPNSDLSAVFNAVRNSPNSHFIEGNSVLVSVEQEYYKTLSNSEDLNITVPLGLNGEVRVLIKIQNLRTEFPFVINYNGQINIYYEDYKYFNPGFYYIFMAESNGLLQVKLIEIGA